MKTLQVQQRQNTMTAQKIRQMLDGIDGEGRAGRRFGGNNRYLKRKLYHWPRNTYLEQMEDEREEASF